MEQLIEFAVYAGKILITFLFIAGLMVLIAGLIMRQKMRAELEVENVNHKLDDLADLLQEALLEKKDYKKYLKDKKKHSGDDDSDKKSLFVLNFKGDIQAKTVDELRDEVTAILTVARPGDDVLIAIESPGGTVHGYGLGAAQILRLKAAGLNVTAAVDKVAASGGYLMACVAPKIIAAPFAILGSIGVLAQVPNFNRLLKKHDVDYEEITAGEYKRTMSILGEITPKGREKFQEQIQDTHNLFKDFVKEHRPQVSLPEVATGEYWFGTRAKNLGLVDEIQTSDAFILSHKDTHRIFKLKYHGKKSFSEKIQESFAEGLARAAEKIWGMVTLR